ncbi:MAG: heme o synthase [Verrucomicrobiales bacterium]|nr:heme o synthase [Verrucomicrobiales bacterium]
MTDSREFALPLARAVPFTARALLTLTKPRVASASILTALAGFAATPGHGGLAEHVLLLAGAGMAAGGTLAFNQWWERDTDPLMGRTRQRPLVQGQISPTLALAWSTLLTLAGIALLAGVFSAATAGIAAAICIIYGFVYTPMKRMTHWATEVGSVSGALPPLLGSAAAGNIWSTPAVVLSVVLLFWQMPHFFAIGWIYRHDYRAAGLPLLPAEDKTGHRTARWSLAYTSLLALVLVLPWLLGRMGAWYGFTATACAVVLLGMAVRFLRQPEDQRARALFRTTLFTLMPLMLALVMDRP